VPGRLDGERQNPFLHELPMTGRARNRWRFWLGVLVVAAVAGLTIAIVLPRKPDASRVQPTAQSDDWKDTLAEVERVRSVPRFAVKREPAPVQAPAGPTQQATERQEIGSGERIPLAAASPVQAKEQPPDGGVRSLTESGLPLRRKLSEHLRRVQADQSSTTSR
jgi:hypothetical protein